MNRPAVEVADILQAQGDTFVEQHPWLSAQQRAVLRAITRCRTAALGGHVDVWAGTLGGAVTRPASTIRVLGVSSPERQPGPAAEMPTFREQGIDTVYYAFRGLLGPGGLTPAQRAFWDQAFSTIVRTDEWKKSELKNGWGAGYLDSAATRKFLDSEYELVRTMMLELGVVKIRVRY